jgi:chromosome partitioning protein
MDITVTAHSKGGSKKSTTTWHLANGLKKRYPKRNIIIVDTDMQQTISIVNEIREHKAKLEAFKVYRPDGLLALASIFEVHKDDIVLVDTGGFDADINRYAIEKATQVIVPLMASIHDVLGFSMFNQILNDIGVSKVNVLITMVHHRQKNFKEIHEALEDYPSARLFDAKIPAHKDNYKPMELGLSVYDIDSKLCKYYDGVIDELKN